MLSSRVRTGRSIKGYTLPPHCSRAERRAVEKLSINGKRGRMGGAALSKIGGLHPNFGGASCCLAGLTARQPKWTPTSPHWLAEGSARGGARGVHHGIGGWKWRKCEV